MATPPLESNTPLVRNLAVTTQIHLPGTAGRIAHQIRQLEAAAPTFERAGLVRKLQRPTPLNVRAAGIATACPPRQRLMGGFLYAAGAVRLDLIIEDNRISTGTQDSVCELDDIDHEDQRIRLQLIGIRQAYELASAAMQDGQKRDLILMDAPLLLSRSMVAPRNDLVHRGHHQAYADARAAIERFWAAHRDGLYPWNPAGPVLVGVSTGRYGAILRVAQQDLRTDDGRRHILPGEDLNLDALAEVNALQEAILSIGERRFLQGVLTHYSRTVAYQLNVQSPGMEPAELAREGVLGFHFKGAQGTAARFAQVVAPPRDFTAEKLDEIAGLLTTMNAIGGPKAKPLPLMLAERELQPLGPFLLNYVHEVKAHIRSGKLERGWLDDLDALD